MKVLLPVIASALFTASAFATQNIINAPVSKLFIPKGFDNNDNVEIVVKGSFPDSCYARNSYSVDVKDELINIEITATRIETDDCKKIEIPYLENITVGSLQAGDYKIVVNNKLKGKLQVTEAASTSVDDYLYGMIQYVELGFTGGASGQFLLVGKTMDCLSFDRVEIISNGKDTLSVLPIMKKTATCHGERKPISIPVNFDIRRFSVDEILLFVRTMDGKSVHALIEQ